MNPIILSTEKISAIVKSEMGFFPSKDQIAAIQAILGGKNIAVLAEAGSGKTTTAEMIIRVGLNVDPTLKFLYVVFNNGAKKEAAAKFGHLSDVCTTHQIGLAALKSHVKAYVALDEVGKIKRDAVKKLKLQNEYLKYADLYMSYVQSVQDFTETLITYYNIAPKNAQHYAEKAKELTDLIVELFEEQLSVKKGIKYAPYELFRYLPVIYNAKLKAGDQIGSKAEQMNYPGKYDIVLFDEAQDSNNVSLELFNCIEFDYFGCFGQVSQAIFLFAGSNANSLPLVIEKYNAELYPLYETRRCTKQICTYVNNTMVVKGGQLVSINPNIWSKKEGEEVQEINQSDMYDWIYEHLQQMQDTVVITRKTVDAINVFMTLLNRKIPAYMKGVDLKALCSDVIKWLEKINKNWETILTNIPVYRARMFDREDEEIKYVDYEKFDDYTVAFMRLYVEASNQKHCSTKEQFLSWIDAFIENENGVCVGVAHRMKGDEYNTVFVYDINAWPYTFKEQSEASYEQEINLFMVALTRARKLLFPVKVN